MTEIYDAEPIGPLLARLREQRGYSQRALANRLGDIAGHPTITRTEVSRWERQERLPSEFWLGHLATALGVPVDLLRVAADLTRDRRTVVVDGLKVHAPTQLAHRKLWEPPGYPVVAAWLTFTQGPKETVVALSGLAVDQIRTVLAPITPTDQPTNTPTSEEPA